MTGFQRNSGLVKDPCRTAWQMAESIAGKQCFKQIVYLFLTDQQNVHGFFWYSVDSIDLH